MGTTAEIVQSMADQLVADGVPHSEVAMAMSLAAERMTYRGWQENAYQRAMNRIRLAPANDAHRRLSLV